MNAPGIQNKTCRLSRAVHALALALLLCVQAGCRAPEQTATVQPTLLVDAPPVTATSAPTAAPTRSRSTPTLVPLVTRTRAPTITPAPTQVPGSVRCTTAQPAGTEGPVWDIEVAPDGAVWVGGRIMATEDKEW